MSTIGIGLSDIGKRRKQNEDGLLVDNDVGLYIVCDGMGGHAAGEVAAETALEATAAVIREERALIECRFGDAPPVDKLVALATRAVQEACREVYRLAMSKQQYSGMGCTLTMAIVAGNKAVMAHVGDTRLYLARKGEAHQLSTDHTMAAELFRAGSISAEQLKGHRFGHVLTRAVGPQASVQVDTLVIDLLPGDRLLLCSDGLATYVPDMRWLAAKLTDADLESVPDTLIAFANDAGGSDNITALVVAVDDPAPLTARPEHAESELNRRFDVLRSIFLFEDLSLAQLARVLNVCATKTFEGQEVIVSEGDPADALYVVLEGCLVLGSEILGRTRLEVGQCIGETTIAYPRRARATVSALERTTLLVLERDRLLELMNQRPWLGARLLRRLARRLSRELDRIHTDADPGALTDIWY